MKRIFTAMAAAIGIAVGAHAATEIIGGLEWSYEIVNGEAILGPDNDHDSCIPQNTDGLVAIPSSLGGATVTAIGGGAFRNCTNLTTVLAPYGVKLIANSAFSSCDKLQNVTIPETVTNIGEYAFEWCKSLTSIAIPSSVNTVGREAFSRCDALVDVKIYDGVKKLGDHVFQRCGSIESVTLPPSLRWYGKGLFEGCTNLTSVTFESGGPYQRYIEDWTFRGCTKLETVILPEGLAHIDDYAFAGCVRLASLDLPSSLQGIDSHAFDGCKSLPGLTIPEKVVSVDACAFNGCSNLVSVVILDGVTKIERAAFCYCTKLSHVRIPPSVKVIEGNAFAGCGLETVDVALEDVTRVKGLLEGSGYDTSGVKFREEGSDLSMVTDGAVFRDGSFATGLAYGNWKLSIVDGATVTISNVTINGSNNPDCRWAGITCEGNATIILQGDNAVKGFYKDYPGIYVPPGKKLTIKGDGSLTASSNGRGAGIGGGYYIDCGEITIEGGSVIATGGEYAAGIGSGYNANCGNILIKTGITHVAATHGSNCTKQIGNGNGGTAAGYNAYGLYTKTIGETLHISPEEIIDPNEISGSEEMVLKNGDILTGEITGKCKICIAAGATVTLSDVTLDGLTEGGYANTDWAGITCLGNATIILEGANYVAGYNECRPGIYVPAGRTLTIKGGGSLIAEGTYRAAGIGGAWKLPSGNIVIESGTVEAHGGDEAAGIGSGCYGNSECGNIVIWGGDVWATGGIEAAGIGSGCFSSCGSITIRGGDVAATGTGHAAGIGGGEESTFGSIYIDEYVSSVKATRGANAKYHIGKYRGETCGDVTIADGLGDALMDDGALRVIAPFVTVRFDANGGTVSPGTRRVVKGTCIGELPEPHKLGYNFKGWYFNSLFNFDAAKETDIASANLRLYAKWAERPTPAIDAGQYFKATLAELGYDVPTDGTPYSVKALGLPAGLKLKYNAAVKNKKGKIVTKAKSTWWIEGVPTAALDYETAPAYLVITANGRTDTMPLLLQVDAQAVVVPTPGKLALGGPAIQFTDWLPGVSGAGWSVTGLPAGLKYTSKAITKQKIPANTVYGRTTKAGVYTITAKKKVNGYYETLKYRVEVTPDGVDAALFGTLGDRMDTAYIAISDWNLKNDVASVGGNVAKVTGLPPGLSFAASTMYKDKKKTQVKQYGQTIVGTPTKAGRYLVTFTKNAKSGNKTVAKTAQVWWDVIANPSAPTPDFNTAGGLVKECSIGVGYAAGDILPSFSVAADATVTASGLPKGIKFTDLGGGQWGFSGYTAKAGTYLVTVKAALNGNTVTQRIALKVNGLPAWAKGSFNGGIQKYSDNSYCGLATMSVTSAGKISGKFVYDGKTWTFSAPCFDESLPAKHYGVDVTAKYAYKAKEKVNGKTVTVIKYLERPFTIYVNQNPYAYLGGLVRVYPGWDISQAAEYGDEVRAYASQNLWGSTYKNVGAKLFVSGKNKYKVFKENVVVGGNNCVLAVKVTTAGKATVTLTYDTGKKTKTGKPVYYKPSCSTVVLPDEAPDLKAFTGSVYMYFAPSADNNFPGGGDCVYVSVGH